MKELEVPSPVNRSPEDPDGEEGDSGIDANSQGSCSSNDVKAREKKKDKKKKKSSNSPSNNDKDTSPQRSPKTLAQNSNNLSQNAATSTKSQNNASEK